MTEIKPNGNGNGVSWKWLSATLVGVLILGGAGWMTAMERRQQTLETDQKQGVLQDTKQRAEQGADIAVIKERIRTIEREVQETKDAVKESGKKLDELLRRR